MCRKGNPDLFLSTSNVNGLACVPAGGHTTWAFEPRGEAYVSVFIISYGSLAFTHQDRIGNSADAMAIQLGNGIQDVTHFIFM